MTHSRRVNQVRLEVSKADQIEAIARRRASLVDHTLAVACLPTLERLFDYSIEVSRSGLGTTSRDGLAQACESGLENVQAELTQRESPLTPQVAFELAGTRAWSIHGLVRLYDVKGAKRVDLRVTGDAPLTVCTGRTWQRGASRWLSPPFLAGQVSHGQVPYRGKFQAFALPVPGCHAIFNDEERVITYPWKHWCPQCDPEVSQRVRNTRRAYARSLAQLEDRVRSALPDM